MDEVNLGAWWQRRGRRTRLILKVLGVLVAAYLILLVGSLISDARASVYDDMLNQSIYCEAIPNHCGGLVAEWSDGTNGYDGVETCLSAYCPTERTAKAAEREAKAHRPNEFKPPMVKTLKVKMLIRHPASGGQASYMTAATATCKYGLENKFHMEYWWSDMYRAHSIHNWCYYGGKIVKRSSTHDAWVTDWGHFLLRYVVKDEWGNNYCAADMSSCLYRFKAWFACCTNVNPVRFSTHRCLATRVCAYVCSPTGAHHSRQVIKGDCPT